MKRAALFAAVLLCTAGMLYGLTPGKAPAHAHRLPGFDVPAFPMAVDPDIEPVADQGALADLLAQFADEAPKVDAAREPTPAKPVDPLPPGDTISPLQPISTPVLTIDREIRPTGQYADFLPAGNCITVIYVGLDGIEPLPSRWLSDPRAFVLDCRGLPPGSSYRFAAVGAYEGKQARADFVLVIPGPPAPPPPPKPVEPPPPVNPPPIPAQGFRALFLEESGERTSKLMSLLHDPEVEAYLNSKCAKDSSGHPEWRVLDPSRTAEQAKLLPENWRLAYDVAKRDSAGKVPWAIVSNGVEGVSVALPLAKAELLALLKKYGGA